MLEVYDTKSPKTVEEEKGNEPKLKREHHFLEISKALVTLRSAGDPVFRGRKVRNRAGVELQPRVITENNKENDVPSASSP